MADPRDTLERFFALERRLLERLSTRVEPFELGTAYLDEEYPDRYVSNFLYVDAPDDVDALIEASDRVLGGAGYRHRNVTIRDDHRGEQLAAAFAERGFQTEQNAVMVHRREPDRPADVPAQRVTFAQARALIAEQTRREEWATSESMVRRFTDQRGKYERVIGAQFFVARVDRKQAGIAELYVDGIVAQVENVGTLEEHRGKGAARAVVLAAIDAAKAAGVEDVFLVADDQDWPKHLYERLGFDRIGRTWTFIRPPDAANR